MKAIHTILILHIILILFASTNFTIVTFAREGTSFSWSVGTFSIRKGFGSAFVSDYSLLQILTYLGGYILGIILFAFIYRKGFGTLGLIGLVLCSLGTVSFVIEGSHWVTEHSFSWISSFPVMMVILWIPLTVLLVRVNRHKRNAEQRAAIDADAQHE